MSWKQPIPTDLDKIFGTDYLAQDLYVNLLLRSANRDGFWTDDKTKRTFPIKRGETIFGRNVWARHLRTSPATIERTLHKLSEIYQKVSYLPSQGFTVVTIKDYDKICDMSEWRASGELVVSTSKIIKNIKNIVTPPKKIVKKPDDGYLSGKIPPLDKRHIFQICDELFVMPQDIRDVDLAVRLEVEDGNAKKYGITNQVLTIKKWTVRKLSEKKIFKRDEGENGLYQRLRMDVFPEQYTNNTNLPPELL